MKEGQSIAKMGVPILRHRKTCTHSRTVCEFQEKTKTKQTRNKQINMDLIKYDMSRNTSQTIYYYPDPSTEKFTEDKA